MTLARTVVCAAALALLPPALAVQSVRAATRESVAPVFPLAQMGAIPYGEALLAPPTAARDVVVLTMASGEVVAWRLDTGLVAWRVSAHATQQAQIVEDALILVTLDALESRALADGALQWQLPLPAGPTAAPAVLSSSILIPTAAPALIVVERATRRLVSQTPLPSPIVSSLAVAADRVVGTTRDAQLVALDISRGTVAWTLAFTRPLSAPTVSAGRAFVGSDDDFFYAVDLSSGRIQWKWRTGADPTGAASVDDAMVYVTAQDNVLRALDARRGNQRWKQSIPSRIVGGAQRYDQTVLVTALTPEVRGVLPATGASAGKFTVDGEAAWPLVLVRGAWPGTDRLLLATLDHRLLVLRRRLDPPMVPLDALPGAVVGQPNAPPLPAPAPPSVP